ncbi:Hsp70 family protein [Arthrobacter sp. SLBN-112]|uniref:Hsp70 family protein n=1 Tax=Arthrobacter sp. SLBN-112 TaxID=2768452 RepID=UPI0027B18E60|nr:Hsp70 family protein [Arthrobacter sp. SLBN-112]MDQ0799916.1 molecular chaperone DnaK [Arthrobacter sp. SLBN-112]
MSYALAVDVGTSYTAAAVVRFDEGASPLPECLPLGLRGTSVPSVVYYPEEGPVLVGEAAERRGLDSPHRVIREFKRRVGDDVPFALGTLTVRPEDVFATMARWVANRAAEREGALPSAIFLTHPASWGIHRLSAIRSALAAQGLDDVTLLPEPEAAALHYASQVRVEEGSTVAVYDLGGGTFDTAVLKKSGGSRFELLGRPDGIEDLGGADFDAAVFRYVAEHTGNALTDPDLTDPAVMGALTRLRRECVEAKEALSADSEATIPVLLPGVQQQVRLVRAEFEALIEEPVRDTVDALEQSLSRLRLEPADLSAVLLIGGSSRIPLVAQLVSEQLDRPIAVDADPKSSICLGAAVAAVLAHTAAAMALATASGPVAAAAGVPAAVVPVPAAPGVPDVPGAPVMPSWSRKYTTTAGAGAVTGPLGGARGARRGAHAPRPTVRVTAVAAAAAILTILTATAAQSPDGLGNLTAMFVPQAGADTGGSGPAGSSGPARTEGPAAGGAAVAANPQPLAGIEASARNPISPRVGLDISASPTSKQQDLGGAATAGTGAADVAAAGGAPAGTGTSGTGVVPDSVTVAPAPPAETAPPSTTGTGTTTPAETATPSETASPSTTTEPTPVSGSTSPTDPATSASPTPTPLSTTGASDPATDPVASPTSVDLTPVPATAPSPTPEETNPTPTPADAAVATAPTTSPAA